MVKNLAVATGKRKTSIARVFLRDGAGAIMVNDKPVTGVLCRPSDGSERPGAARCDQQYREVRRADHGSGAAAFPRQIEACRHGIARALNAYDATNHTALRANGFLTRDPRMVERKKYGQAGARRRFQFSKR